MPPVFCLNPNAPASCSSWPTVDCQESPEDVHSAQNFIGQAHAAVTQKQTGNSSKRKTLLHLFQK